MTKIKIFDSSTRFVQEVGMSHAEKIAMYNKCSKKELIEMLIASNNQLQQAIVHVVDDTKINHTYKKITSG